MCENFAVIIFPAYSSGHKNLKNLHLVKSLRYRVLQQQQHLKSFCTLVSFELFRIQRPAKQTQALLHWLEIVADSWEWWKWLDAAHHLQLQSNNRQNWYNTILHGKLQRKYWWKSGYKHWPFFNRIQGAPVLTTTAFKEDQDVSLSSLLQMWKPAKRMLVERTAGGFIITVNSWK